jgi:hypothetical protein
MSEKNADVEAEKKTISSPPETEADISEIIDKIYKWTSKLSCKKKKVIFYKKNAISEKLNKLGVTKENIVQFSKIDFMKVKQEVQREIAKLILHCEAEYIDWGTELCISNGLLKCGIERFRTSRNNRETNERQIMQIDGQTAVVVSNLKQEEAP